MKGVFFVKICFQNFLIFLFIQKRLIPLDHVLLPNLHMKLGIFTKLMQGIVPNSQAFQYLVNFFDGELTPAKIQQGICNGPQIRKLLNDTEFPSYLTVEQKTAWEAFKNVVHYVLYQTEPIPLPTRKMYVKTFCDSVNALKVNGMNFKLHLLDRHLDKMVDIPKDYSDEQGELFHQVIDRSLRQYQPGYLFNMFSDQWWRLMKEDDDLLEHKRRSNVKNIAGNFL